MTFELDDLLGGLITIEPMAGGCGSETGTGLDDSTLEGVLAWLASERGATGDGVNGQLVIERSALRTSRLLDFAANNGRAWLRASRVSADLAGLTAELNCVLARIRRRIENSR